MKRRFSKRYTKRLETEYSAGGRTYKGISSDLSENGLFIRTSRGLPVGSPIEMTVYLPDGKPSRLRGIVRRAATSLSKNGMGVELTYYDEDYHAFLKTVIEGDFEPLTGKAAEKNPAPGAPAYRIIKCGACGVNNRVGVEKLPLGPRCGRCKEPLSIS